jgi:hypothetical protein
MSFNNKKVSESSIRKILSFLKSNELPVMSLQNNRGFKDWGLVAQIGWS